MLIFFIVPQTVLMIFKYTLQMTFYALQIGFNFGFTHLIAFCFASTWIANQAGSAPHLKYQEIRVIFAFT